MNLIAQRPSFDVRPTVFTAEARGRARLRDFFGSHLRNPHTRRAYLEAVRQFSSFCAEMEIRDLGRVEPIHVAAFVDSQLRRNSRGTVVVGQVIPPNPAQAGAVPGTLRNPAAPRFSEPTRRELM